MERFVVTGIQACEPEFLAQADGIEVVVEDGLDSMGFNTVQVTAPTREALLGYVRSQWGDEDPEWFQTYIVDRVWVTSQ